MLLKNMLDLNGKTALITGGSGFLGSAMAEALAEFGATVIIASRNNIHNVKFSELLSEKYLNTNIGMELDVTNNDSVKKCIETIIERYSKIDILINNASSSFGKDLLSMSEDQWISGIDGTVSSVYRCTRFVLPWMIKQERGKIINIASMYGIVAPDVQIYQNNAFYNPPNYGVGKAGIIQFTKYIAAVYGKYGIQSNSVSPGPFPNNIVQEDKEFIQNLCKKVPLGRIGNPDDLKGIILLLATDASNYINGANIVVDGGWTIW